MNSEFERRRRIEWICEAALARDPRDRSSFLAEACADDAALRADVEALLVYEPNASRFLAAPLGAVAASAMVDSRAPREELIGRRIGAFEVVSSLGAGGMGEVYRARDTKLRREVAIKVLPPEFVADRDRLARFEREARVLAALNHPHIAAIYGVEQSDGIRALVLELVEGETLAERIGRAPLRVGEALAIARQIAEGLEAAHEKGIVHRDLKPANIKVTADGAVKVLDFGLARLDDRSGADLSQSPTLTIGATHEGVLLGTSAYMSPEQARGQTVDRRTDIWSFGCVLYEMLTGVRAFAGSTTSDCVAAILEREPDWSVLPKGTPAGIQRLLRRCLEKTPRRRLHDIADARIEMDEATTEPSPLNATMRQVNGRRKIVIAWVGGAVAGAAIAGIATRAVTTRSTTSAAPGVTRSLISLQGANFESLALSPDGRTLAFIGTRNGRSQLYVRPLDRPAAIAMDGTADAAYPFFSPDGRWIAFVDKEQLKKIAVTGGAPQRLGSRYNGWFRGAAWNEDGTIIYARKSDVWRMSGDGNSQQVVAAPDTSRREKTLRWPELLPDGESVLLTVATADTDSWDDARIELLSLRTGKRRVLIEGGTCPRYVRSGHIVYARKGNLLAVPFALDRLQVLGPPLVVLENVFVDRGTGYAGFAIGSNGSVVFAPAPAKAPVNQLWWMDRTGKAELAADTGRASGPVSLSPDGRRAALVADETNATIWICDLVQHTIRRFTSGWDNIGPMWTPDGQRITFSSNRDAGGEYFNLYSQREQGGAPAERLTRAQRGQIPIMWSPNGRTLLFGEASFTEGPFLMLFDREVGTATRFIDRVTQWGPEAAAISPDGQWIAHLVDGAGEIGLYVSRFPGGSPTFQISNDDNRRPRWAPGGKELYYVHGGQLMAVDITTAPQFSAGKPRALFDTLSDDYDLSPDGKRFLFARQVGDSALSELNLAENWSQELSRVATNR